MNLCHVITGLRPGGAELSLLHLTGHSKGIHNTSIIACNADSNPALVDALQANGASVHLLNNRHASYPWNIIAHILQLRRLFSEAGNSTIIISHLYWANVVCSLALLGLKTRHIIWLHNHKLPGHHRKARLLRRVAAIATAFSNPYGIAPLPLVLDFHRRLGFRFRGSFLVGSFIKSAPHNPATQATTRGATAPRRGLSLGIIARCVPGKGIEKLIAVARAFPDITFTFFTTAAPIPAHLSQSMAIIQATNNILVRFNSGESTPPYARLDYTMILSDSESYSNVIGESFSAGTPIISTPVGLATLPGLEEFSFIADSTATIDIIKAVERARDCFEHDRSRYDAYCARARDHFANNLAIDIQFQKFSEALTMITRLPD